MILRNAIFILIAATPLFCLQFAGTIHHYTSNGGAYDFFTYLEEYGNPNQGKQNEFSTELLASRSVEGASVAEPVMNIGVDEEFFKGWLEEVNKPEPTLRETYLAWQEVSDVDLIQIWQKRVAGVDGWQFLRVVAGIPQRAPAVAERPVHSPFIFSSHQTSLRTLNRERSIEENAENQAKKAFPKDITPGHYRVVDNLGLVTEVVITDTEIDLFTNKDHESNDHYVLRQGERVIYFIRLKSPVTARQNQVIQRHDHWISRMNREHVGPTIQMMLEYAMPVDQATAAMRSTASQALEAYQQMGETLEQPTRLSNGLEDEQLR
ncbi:hypothetical protein Pla110_32060 [Polystyrenella longa]|uniref:Uncharacterized protein n=1 Tax=Polystyrenella longa TaxID=2528007 RepID=A0A518CQI5_9PLAN|nr:hypothetical protein [Polystyrenella longa]QDU81464.1 hypothetical protein Pla110_32060 [Polystyrenella longa]